MTDTNGTRSDESGHTPDTTEPPSTAPGYFKAGPVVMLMIGAIVVVLDQIAKIVAVVTLEPGRPVELIGETVRLVLIRNPGAAFSMGTDLTPVLSVVAILVVLGLLWFSRRVHSRWWAWGLGLILGGAAGNLVDRVLRDPGALHGHVVDYMAVGWWPVFNIADACLVTGVIVVAVAVLRNIDYDGSLVSDREPESAAPTGAEPKAAGPTDAAAESGYSKDTTTGTADE